MVCLYVFRLFPICVVLISVNYCQIVSAHYYAVFLHIFRFLFDFSFFRTFCRALSVLAGIILPVFSLVSLFIVRRRSQRSRPDLLCLYGSCKYRLLWVVIKVPGVSRRSDVSRFQAGMMRFSAPLIFAFPDYCFGVKQYPYFHGWPPMVKRLRSMFSEFFHSTNCSRNLKC